MTKLAEVMAFLALASLCLLGLIHIGSVWLTGTACPT